ncbi:hypothetical protein DFJ58DRAFT_817920 [Suillus subalutaceus]|uniref:uncharacterized protein n=1 Tax=Suillus subalutaceus TaxID=48586 RepID=UPI001B881B4A|nr:uncharacterized protein DFJ58DRAFT_817920 [Suillus subalutaceus]KAG1836744.1 hypothetical protein DFJ58DRAFT_817920 [Suillus subalutaceus]
MCKRSPYDLRDTIHVPWCHAVLRRCLLALGNILFLSGLTLIIGPQKTFYFFARKQKLRGTASLAYSFIGFLNLFGDFFPVVVTFLRQVPFIGNLLSLPYIRPIVDRIAGSRTSAV